MGAIAGLVWRAIFGIVVSKVEIYRCNTNENDKEDFNLVDDDQ